VLYNVLYVKALLRVIIPGGLIRKLPKEVALRNGALILTIPVYNGNGCITVVPKLFKALPESIVIIYIGRGYLWPKKKQNVLFRSSFTTFTYSIP
jgi:hypothetical protein